MPVIYIDGPEKAGKTTFITALQQHLHTFVRKWGPVHPDDRVYASHLRNDIEAPRAWVWDRGWISEAVYGELLERKRRLSKDWWLGEWLYGRALQTDGIAVVLLGPSAERLSALRKEDDLAVDVTEEREAFRRYATRFGIGYFENDHDDECMQAIIEFVVAALDDKLQKANLLGLHVPHWAGPPDARVVFVGQNRNDDSRFPGAWLPFSTRLTQLVGRQLGDAALRCGWTNAQDVPPQTLTGRTVVACGELAHMWVESHARPEQLYKVKHPAWMYRYRNETTDDANRELTETIIRIKELI